MKRVFTAAVHQEEDWHVARCLEVIIASQGRSAEEAVNNLAEAVQLHLEDADEAPDPNPLITSFEVDP